MCNYDFCCWYSCVLFWTLLHMALLRERCIDWLNSVNSVLRRIYQYMTRKKLWQHTTTPLLYLMIFMSSYRIPVTELLAKNISTSHLCGRQARPDTHAVIHERHTVCCGKLVRYTHRARQDQGCPEGDKEEERRGRDTLEPRGRAGAPSSFSSLLWSGYESVVWCGVVSNASPCLPYLSVGETSSGSHVQHGVSSGREVGEAGRACLQQVTCWWYDHIVSTAIQYI